jgi:hypothetical protein
MINITCSNGITTVENTDYNVMPVVRFVNPVGSYISEAKGMYNGHYYWILNGLAPFGVLPAAGDVYIWFNTSQTEWWATNTLGGGFFYDNIQSPTNTLYPLDAFTQGSFDAGTLISPANGLAKSYFNINGKFHTKETIFYVYLANDVYEIPLAKLQVNGSPQATMQDGINALAAILVNAGSSGGGSVVSDNITIQGNGTIASPLTSSLKYHFNQPTINEPGIYVYDGSFSGSIFFNEMPYAYGSQTVYVINTGFYALATDGAHQPCYDGYGGNTVSYLQGYATWTLVWNGQDTEYRIINPNFAFTTEVDLDTYGSNYSITLANSLYRFFNNSTGYDIYLPDPANFYGKKISIINNYIGILGYNAGGYQPKNAAGGTVTSIGAVSSTTIISDGATWRVIN